MALRMTTVGGVVLQESGQSAAISEALRIDAGDVTKYSKGQLDLAAGTAITTIPAWSSPVFSYIQITCTDKTTGAAKGVTITLDAVAIPGTPTEFILSDAAAAAIAAVKVTVAASGNNTLVNYILAGS